MRGTMIFVLLPSSLALADQNGKSSLVFWLAQPAERLRRNKFSPSPASTTLEVRLKRSHNLKAQRPKIRSPLVYSESTSPWGLDRTAELLLALGRQMAPMLCGSWLWRDPTTKDERKKKNSRCPPHSNSNQPHWVRVTARSGLVAASETGGRAPTKPIVFLVYQGKRKEGPSILNVKEKLETCRGSLGSLTSPFFHVS